MPNFNTVESSADFHFQVAVPLISTQHITQFTGSALERYAGKVINGVIDKYAQEQDRVYLTQRPGISLQDDASTYTVLYYTDGGGTPIAVGDTVTDGTSGATGVVLSVDTQAANSILVMNTVSGAFGATHAITAAPSGGGGTINASGVITPTVGRGIYFWSANQTRYIANSRGVYQADYETPCRLASATGTPLIFAAGTEKVYFIEWQNSAGNDYLFIVDPQGNKMYYIDSSADDVVQVCTSSGTTASSDAFDFSDLPQNQSPALNICHGVEILDQYMFLGSTDGRIWNSAVGDLLNWSSALDYVNAERESDGLLYITKSRDHIVAFGQKTIEIFYDASNPSPGSPLSRRTDIFYNTGIVNGESAWRDGDEIWFLGTSPHGDLGFYKFGTDFSIIVESSPSMNSYFRNDSVETADVFKTSGFSTGRHTYVLLTSFNSSNVPQISLAFDSYTGMWSEWQTQLRGHTLFPMIGVTVRTQEEFVSTEGLYSNGDIFTIRDDLNPLDLDNSTGYFLEDYEAESGVDSYDVDTGEITIYQIDLYSIVSNFDAGTMNTKFFSELSYFGSVTNYANTLDVKFSSDNGRTWGSTYTLDTTTIGSAFRLGKFKRYDIQAHFKGGEQMRIESLLMLLTKGTGT